MLNHIIGPNTLTLPCKDCICSINVGKFTLKQIRCSYMPMWNNVLTCLCKIKCLIIQRPEAITEAWLHSAVICWISILYPIIMAGSIIIIHYRFYFAYIAQLTCHNESCVSLCASLLWGSKTASKREADTENKTHITIEIGRSRSLDYVFCSWCNMAM